MGKTDPPKDVQDASVEQQEAYTGITSQLQELVDKVNAYFTGSTDDGDRIFEAIEALGKMEYISEEDRLAYLSTFCSLAKLLIDKFPENNELVEVTKIYEQYNALLYYLYSTDSLYNQSIKILYEYIGILERHEDTGDAFATAIRKTSALPYSNESLDLISRGKALSRIFSASLAYEWLMTPRSVDSIVYEGEKELARLMDHIRIHSFDKAEIINTFHRVEELGKKYTGDVTQLTITLLRIYGLGILLAPQYAPALEILEDKVIQLSNQYGSQYVREENNTEAITPKEKSAEEIISAFTALVSRDGTSEYAFNQAVADIKRLPQESEENYRTLMNSLLSICDISIENSSDDKVIGPIQVTKESIMKMMAMVDTDQKPYTIKELKSLLQQDLAELKLNLENGELPGTAITRFIAGFQAMTTNISEEPEGGEDEMGEIFTVIFNDFLKVIGNYISADQQAVWKEVVKTMGFVTDAWENRDDSEPDLAIETKRMEEQGQRLINAGLHLPVLNQSMSTYYILQFLDLYPGLADRFLHSDIDDHSDDKKEFDRLKADLEDTFRLLSSAYTMEQFMQHQKVSLRRMSIELSQFERRRYLMMANPVFPANNIVVDPNRIFFSGTGELVNSILNACNTLGMVLATKRSVSNQLDARWSQLRESAVIIFDYSGYDPAKSDPTGLIQSASYNEHEVLEDAGPVAIVAYENGWAYTLGKPVVIITKKGKPIPFDIDIEPVVLEEDGKDEERIISGIQTALYGVNRNTRGSCLEETLEYARSLFKNREDEKVQTLLNSMKGTGDATRVRLTIETILDRVNDKNQMLIMPAFPGGYPDPLTKKVFHVTGFRDWSKPLEVELKRICVSRGFDFAIGYEKINPEILPAIWKDITEASFLVADITNLNPNAVLELAMAQAIGRPTLILTQNKEVQKYFPPVQKTRTHIYDPYKSKPALTALIENFFDGKE